MELHEKILIYNIEELWACLAMSGQAQLICYSHTKNQFHISNHFQDIKQKYSMTPTKNVELIDSSSDFIGPYVCRAQYTKEAWLYLSFEYIPDL